MRLPGFTAEAAMYNRAAFFHTHAPVEEHLSADSVTPSWQRPTCPPGASPKAVRGVHGAPSLGDFGRIAVACNAPRKFLGLGPP